MKAFLMMLTLLLAQTTPPAQTPHGVVRGRLVEVGTGDAIADAEIVLQISRATVIDNSPTIRTTSDQNGKFIFNDVPTGQHTLIVRQDGYLSEDLVLNAQTVLMSAQLSVSVSATQQETPEILVSLVHGAVISGRVFGVDGLPLRKAVVRAVEIINQNGIPVLRNVADRDTNDLGEYRLFWLKPGEYYIQVSPARDAAANGTQIASGPGVGILTYYPDAFVRASAKGIIVKPGDEVSGIDVRLRSAASAPKSFKISGQVLSTLSSPGNSAGVPIPAAAFLLYFPHDVSDETGQTTIGNSDIATGHFEALVPSGSYDLYARIASVQQGTQQRNNGAANAWGRAQLVVRDHDVEGIAVVVHPSVDVEGVLRFPGGTSPAKEVRVGLEPDDSSVRIGNFTVVAERPVVPTPDGSFKIARVAEADYKLQITGLPADFYVADVRQGTSSIYGSTVHVGDKPSAPLEIFVAANGGSIQGTVTNNNGQPVASATLTMVAIDASTQKAMVYKTATADDKGQFAMRGIRPGEYTVFASLNVFTTSFQSSDFLANNQQYGRPLKVDASSRNELQITLIPRER